MEAMKEKLSGVFAPSVAAGVTISPEVIKRVSSHPNVRGLKDSSKGNFERYRERICLE